MEKTPTELNEQQVRKINWTAKNYEYFKGRINSFWADINLKLDIPSFSISQAVSKLFCNIISHHACSLSRGLQAHPHH